MNTPANANITPQTDRRRRWRPEFVEPLVQQSRFVVTFVLSAVITAVALSYAYSERYETFSVVTFRPQDVTRIKAVETQAFGAPVPVAPFKVIGQTLQQLARSPDLLEQLVEEFDLDNLERAYDGPLWKVRLMMLKDEIKDWAGDMWMLLKFGRIIESDPTVDAMQKLAKAIKIRSEDSYVFNIMVRDRSAERAAEIANRIAEIVVEQQRDEERRPGELKRKQVAALLATKSEQLEEARAEIDALLTNHRLASVDLETERIMERYSKLALERSKLSAEISQAETQISAIDELLTRKHRNSAARNSTPASPAVIQAEDFKRLASTRLGDAVELAGMRARREALNESLTKLSTRLQELPEVQITLASKKMAVSVLERDYVQLADAYQEAVIRATGLTSEFKFQTPAIVPSLPVSPIKFYHAALSGTLGLLVAIGLVYMLTYFNIRILFASRGIGARRNPPAPAAEPQPLSSGDSPHE